MDISKLNFDQNGLIPAIVQDLTGEVLMLAYMNRESLEKSLETGYTWFYSRSRQKLWNKGETSGNLQKIFRIVADCDYDSLLITIEQLGTGACHEGDRSCFHKESVQIEQPPKINSAILQQLYQIVKGRKENPKEGSYTNYLFEKGIDKILKKVGEETAEVIIGAKNAVMMS